MHFDPAASTHDSSAIQDRRLGSEDYLDQDIDREPEAPPASRGREGLPPAFRMRHARHYVEQLMGDAPLRTVKEIAVADIEPPPPDGVDIEVLEQSIRRMGVLEPLLVGQHGRRYRVIAGMNRLRAATKAGLGTVPCLVHDVDEEMMENMRQATAQRAAAPPSREPAFEPPRDEALPPAFEEITEGLSFVSALLPAIDAAGDDRFRWSVLTSLAEVELARTRTVAASAAVLAGPCELARAEASGVEVVDGTLRTLGTATRLRRVRLETSLPDGGYQLSLDRERVALAITGIVEAMLSLVQGPGDLRVTVRGTDVRPALIVSVSQGQMRVSSETASRFFDAGWREHPAGTAGALMLAAAQRIARLHGGRMDVQLQPEEGCTVTIVVPRPV